MASSLPSRTCLLFPGARLAALLFPGARLASRTCLAALLFPGARLASRTCLAALLILACLRDSLQYYECSSNADCQYPRCLQYAIASGRIAVCALGRGGSTQYPFNVSLCQLGGVNFGCLPPPCVPGEYKAAFTKASTVYSKCLECQPGSFSIITEAFGTAFAPIYVPPYSCAACPAHHYQNQTGQASCQPCRPGAYQYSTGQSACLSCPASACPVGTYLANATCREECKPCSACPAGQSVVIACEHDSDTVCGSVEQCALANVSSLAAYDWMTGETRCRKGEYLWGLGPPPDYTRTCQRCPTGMAGLNGMYCEKCGELQRPYHLDQASCVCVESAVMNASGACVCRDGFTLAGTCVLCGRNTYGVGGYCYACQAGTVSSAGSAGPGSCAACAEGSYRSTNQTVCTGCGMGWHAPDATGALGCVECNTSCPIGTTREPCPGAQNGANYSRCAGCAKPLPGNASWTVGCAYDCRAGFYRVQDGCRACTVDKACPAGYRASACGADWDANCDTVCTNASKPEFYSAWLVSRDCQWGCQSGYTLVVTDYWMFKVFECVPGV
jgi:hypothetical protein